MGSEQRERQSARQKDGKCALIIDIVSVFVCVVMAAHFIYLFIWFLCNNAQQ